MTTFSYHLNQSTKLRSNIRHCVLVWSLIVVLVASLVPWSQVHATSLVSEITPNADGTTTSWTPGGTNDGSCQGGTHCDYVDEPVASINTNDYVQSNSDAAIEQFAMGTTPIEDGATQVVVNVSSYGAAVNGTADTITVNVTIGTAQAAQTVTVAKTTNKTDSFTFTGNWSQTDIDGMTVQFTQHDLSSFLQCGLSTCAPDTVRITALSAQVTYTPYPRFGQSAYRIYQNSNSSTPGSTLAANSTAGELPSDGAAFRVRMLTHITVNNLSANYTSLKLQAALKSGTCDTGFVGESYSDVSRTTGAIRFNVNSAVSTGSTVTTTANDPTHGSDTVIPESYMDNNPVTEPTAALIGQDAMWDFSLYDAAATPGSSYCFRMAYNNGNILSSYSVVPEILTVGTASTGVVDSSGNAVANPTLTFGNASVLTNLCQTVSATLGTATQKLRITNDIAVNGWDLSIAPTNGTGATWSDGTHHYDYDDPGGTPAGCIDGADADSLPGSLSIDPSTASVAPKSGCSTLGTALGPDASFSGATVGSISLLSADATSQRFCYWDITGITAHQTIPAGQPPGAYTLGLTITVVAN